MPASITIASFGGECEIRNVPNVTRDDARDFLALAATIGLRPHVQEFKSAAIEEALLAVRYDNLNGAAVVTF